MKKEMVSEVITRIDEKYIDEANLFNCLKNRRQGGKETVRTNNPMMWFPRSGRVVLGACLAVVLLLGSTAFALTAEAREYRSAVVFFEENGLSMEGLSRSDVKAVYRDIRTESFTLDKTADVILRHVPGWELQQQEPTCEELAALWDLNSWRNNASADGAPCRITYEYTPGEGRIEKCRLLRIQNGETLWSAEFTDFYVAGYLFVGDKTLLWGWNDTQSTLEPVFGRIVCVDAEGQIQWQRRLDHGFEKEFIAAVLDNEDETFTVISRGDLKNLCLSSFDASGNELHYQKTEVGNLGIWNVVALEDGYLIQLGNLISRDTALLVKTDRGGTLLDSFCYESEKTEYYIMDMAVFNGQVFLSAYAVPKQTDDGGRNEIANVLDYVATKGEHEISSAELTPIVRENYTAVLLLCDPESGTPRTFYSVNGSLGGKLTQNEAGQLEWGVESLVSTFYSPATSSFTIGGTCKLFCYSFDADGNLIGQKDTKEMTEFRR